MQQWPDDFLQFAWIPNLDDQLNDLASLAEPETWAYQFTENDHQYPILFNYLRFTYQRIAEERKINLSDNADFACFNTGLVTPNQESIFASFEINRRPDAQQWYFKGWFRRGQREMNIFPELPELAHYFDDPSVLVLDVRKPFRVNIEHIIEETPSERFPSQYRSMSSYGLQTMLNGAIENAKQRVRRNYKTAIPQYYRGRVQLLLPLCLDDPQKTDLALVVDIHDEFYRASTCLTLDMAYNNARQLARPDRDWLKP